MESGTGARTLAASARRLKTTRAQEGAATFQAEVEGVRKAQKAKVSLWVGKASAAQIPGEWGHEKILTESSLRDLTSHTRPGPATGPRRGSYSPPHPDAGFRETQGSPHRLGQGRTKPSPREVRHAWEPGLGCHECGTDQKPTERKHAKKACHLWVSSLQQHRVGW